MGKRHKSHIDIDTVVTVIGCVVMAIAGLTPYFYLTFLIMTEGM